MVERRSFLCDSWAVNTECRSLNVVVVFNELDHNGYARAVNVLVRAAVSG